ncbi:MAG TPA: SpvB/TcaC N-terminal domain-containing protein, partial [Longimicrobiaceae bacterium]|nr:SpvB/TcaC N-terminal domain-containing protein [Longimicrobiaceae bacterium]
MKRVLDPSPEHDRPDVARADGQKAGEPAPLLPVVSLPRGGAAIRGIGETFAVSPATGTCSFTVPIHTSPGRSGFGPQLALSYDSGAGNGPFGLGWSVQLPTVTRRTDRGIPRYHDGVEGEEDTFLLAGAEDLVPALVQGPGGWTPDAHERVEDGDSFRVRRYRSRTEGSFARIECWESAASGEVHWRVVSREGVTSLFGRTPGARIADPAAPDRVFSGLLEEMRDDRGNLVRYAYRAEDAAGVDPALPHERNRLGPQANRYPERITYGNRVPGDASDCVFEVVFDYGDHHPEHPTPEPDRDWSARADAFSAHRAGFEVRTRRLCRRVLVFHRFAELGPEPRLVRSTDFAYDERPDITHLVGVRQRGYVPGRAPDETPEVRFAYTAPGMDGTVRTADAAELPEGVDGTRWRWVDLEGEGAAGILAEQEGAWYYAPNRGGARFGPPRALATAPTPSELRGGRQQLVDLRGDGRTHLVAYAGETAGFWARAEEAPGDLAADEERGWEPFRVFARVPKLDWGDSNLRWVDVDGDGRADVLIAGDDVFTWYPSRAEEGLGAPERAPKPGVGWDEEQGPALVFADGTESVHLADMDGDGLADIVRVRNGDVCYWPGQGHGRFGAKVTMDAAPAFDHPDRWDPRRLRLADVDGTGTTDLLYLGGERVAYWSNQAGNRWSPAREVPAFPPTDSLASVAVADLLGSGTSCLVWSSPLPGNAGAALRYVDLTGGKPHLLRAIDNGRGGETRVEYAPSTRFYLEDREAGRPWATRLPFPVQVVVRTETMDHVSGHRFVTRYAYAHGCWDGEEREFRGFGRVDRWDAEEWSGDPLDQPPVRTRSWFHTGIWNPEDGLVRRFAEEFWAGDPQAWPRPDSLLPTATRPSGDPALPPTELSVAELREAWRALRGRPLRQETYADDGAPESVHPYVVVEHAYQVECLQPRRGTADEARHAVFVAHEREARTWHYERDPADPRVQQALTLRVDGYGNVLESAAGGYPRRVPAGPAAAEQARSWITATVASVANRDDHPEWRRIGVPVESASYELTGVALPAGRPLTAAALRDALAAAQAIPDETAPTSGGGQTRAVPRIRQT